MPNHRFHEELSNLENKPIKGVYNNLIIGTFNAENQDGLNNDAEWFYGRYKNEFWYLYPQLLGDRSLHRRENDQISLIELANLWKSYCFETKTIIIDIYKYVANDLASHSDELIKNPIDYISFNHMVAFENASFSNIIFTWKNSNVNSTLGVLKDNISQWFIARGSNIFHMVSPSYAYPQSKESKLEKWRHAFNLQ